MASCIETNKQYFRSKCSRYEGSNTKKVISEIFKIGHLRLLIFTAGYFNEQVSLVMENSPLTGHQYNRFAKLRREKVAEQIDILSCLSEKFSR